MEWHHECFENFAQSIKAKREEAVRRASDLERAERDLEFYQVQIATANARGLSGFDRDKLLVKRKT
jgi:hypothetical protein